MSARHAGGHDPASDFPPGRWAARWIWAAPTASNESARSVVALYRDVEVAVVPPVVPARVFAVARYVLLVNGAEVARGPLRATPGRERYDVVDLAPHLRRGANRIAVCAWTYAQAMPWWLPPRFTDDALAGGAIVFEAHLGDDVVISDGLWRATPLESWVMAPAASVVSGRGDETVDAAALPADWHTVGGATDWSAAVELWPSPAGSSPRPHPPTIPVGPFGPRPLPWPSVRPVALAPARDGAWTAPALVAGSVRVDIQGPSGSFVVGHVAERLDARGHPVPNEHDAAFTIRCDGTRRTVETLESYGLTGVSLASAGGAEVCGVEVVERLHPVTGDAYFRCSDERLDTMWEVGRRTVSLCSWDAYLDCPTREQRAWTGDAVVHQMVDLATNADWSLASWYPLLSASPRPDGMLPMAVAGEIQDAGRTVIADWALHWIHSVWNLYRYAGDRDAVAELLPAAEGVLRWFARACDADGLPHDVPGGVLVDWASVYTDGVSATLCGLWGRALLEFAEMAEWLGDGGRTAWARRLHTGLATGFERLWDAQRGRYADVLRDGMLQPMASQHGQAAAIVGRLAPTQRLGRLVDVITDERHLVHATFSAPDGPAPPGSEIEVGGDYLFHGPPEPWWDVDTQVVRAQPFFRYVVHDALVQAGRGDLLTTACLDWLQALERCPTTWTETWFGGTICHGWSSTPTRDLTVYVLGIQPAEPGFASARIAPTLGHLDWAAGSAPTPHGPIEVRVDRSTLHVDSPVPLVVDDRSYDPGRHAIERGPGGP